MLWILLDFIKVIDAYLAHLTQAEFDKGRKVKHEAVSTMTSIINDTHKPKRNEVLENNIFA